MSDKMAKTVSQFDHSLVGIRLGTVTPGLIDTIKVEYFGQKTPIGHLASTSSERASVLVRPHDPAMVGVIANSLKAAGFNAYPCSKTHVVVSVPPLSGEERERVKAHVRKLGEEAKVAIRNTRRNFRDKLLKELPEDEKKLLDKQIQEKTDEMIEEVNQIVLSRVRYIG